MTETNEEKNQTAQDVRLMGIDFGSKRVGVALSDPSRKFALPLSVIENGPELLAEVVKVAKDNGVKEIILGESRDYKGMPNEIFIDSLEFKDKLEASGFSVIFEPEFMTSVQAERFQGKTDLTDASAAALILQSYLDKVSNQTAAPLS
ncbi:MAG: RuvX/YqgF family protein [Candidatus Paceibacterota bacterium]